VSTEEEGDDDDGCVYICFHFELRTQQEGL